MTIPALFLFSIAIARTIIVGNDQAFKSLKQAIASATNGDTILLQKGIYKEGNIILTKSLTIIGNGAVLDEKTNMRYSPSAGKISQLKISSSEIPVIHQ